MATRLFISTVLIPMEVECLVITAIGEVTGVGFVALVDGCWFFGGNGGGFGLGLVFGTQEQL
jgi:hypothetical protein